MKSRTKVISEIKEHYPSLDTLTLNMMFSDRVRREDKRLDFDAWSFIQIFDKVSANAPETGIEEYKEFEKKVAVDLFPKLFSEYIQELVNQLNDKHERVVFIINIVRELAAFFEIKDKKFIDEELIKPLIIQELKPPFVFA